LAGLPELHYGVDLTQWPLALRSRFVQLHCDAGTHDYLERMQRARHGRLRSWLHRALRNLWSDFDVNGLLGMYPMHLLSTEQWRELLGTAAIERCLDVGAGSGDITQTLMPLCSQTEASETSAHMVRRLRKRGIVCQEIDLTASSEELGPFDLITCLNVLDRCARPRSLLQRLRSALSPGGRLVVAMALPYKPFYFVGARTPEPEERLVCDAAAWEEAVVELVQGSIAPLGLTLEAVARAPYLSGGDAASPLYVLDDVILVLRNASVGPS
jgi:2-polyprenyl-3-methyl-5-hydroxy-6-metoxy-1,4-benzoquinol methylase